MKERGCLQLPSMRLNHKAICFSFLGEWVTLSNYNSLYLEGHININGWHAFLYNEKSKTDVFSYHDIRTYNVNIQLKYNKSKAEKRTLQGFFPAEVIKLHFEYQKKDYKDL